MTYKERIAAAQAKMDAFKAKMASAREKAKAASALKKDEVAAAFDSINTEIGEFEDKLAETKAGNKAAAEENARLAKERHDSKVYARKLRAQMRSESIKEKIAARRAAKDQAAMERYILSLISYAEACQEVAFSAAVEAELSLLEAAAVAAEYIEKYGEDQISEEAAAEVAAEAAEEPAE
ncbi:MAG: hypothetical protein J5851_10875 [Oscillospiraceae bacterium]|nr:hypothetical protein [Oscillospiraceae bacterium]